MPWIAPLVMMAAATAKHFAVDQPMANRQRKEEAATTRYSPWTGLVGRKPNDPNLAAGLIQGGLAGAQFGQQFGGGEEGISDATRGVADQGVPSTNIWDKMGGSFNGASGAGNYFGNKAVNAGGWDLDIMKRLQSLRGYNP